MAPLPDGPPWLLPALESLGFVLALASAVLAARAHRIARAKSLQRFSWGFTCLALAQAAALWLELEGLRTVPEPGVVDVFDAAFWTYYAFLLLGLGLVFSSFGRRPFRWSAALTLLIWTGPVLQLMAVTVLFFIVLHAGLNHIARARKGSLRTATGFFLLLVAHLLFLADYVPLVPRTWEGELAHTAGLLLLLLSLVRARKS